MQVAFQWPTYTRLTQHSQLTACNRAKITYELQSVPEKTVPAIKGRINDTATGATKTADTQTQEMI